MQNAQKANISHSGGKIKFPFKTNLKPTSNWCFLANLYTSSSQSFLSSPKTLTHTLREFKKNSTQWSRFGDVQYCPKFFIMWRKAYDWTSYWVVLFFFCGAVYYAEQGGSNFWVCEWNPKVWPFKWKLLSSTFLWYCLLCCPRWF